MSKTGKNFEERGPKDRKNFGARQIAVCGLLIALAYVTSFIKLFTMPMSGSVVLLSMFFMSFIGYLYGPVCGIVAGVAYGLLQFAQNPQLYYPLQFVFDYILAFGALGLSGFFRSGKHALSGGYLIGVTGRFIFATLSGAIFFGEYAWDGWNPYLYSAVYNGIYIYTEAMITVVIVNIPLVKHRLEEVKRIALG